MTQHNDLANHICYWVNQWGGLAFIHDSVGIYDPVRKVMRSNKNPFRKKGVADILGIWRIKPLAIEVKVGRDRLSPVQTEFRVEWERHGGLYILAYGLLDVKTGLGDPDNTLTKPGDASEILKT